MRILFMILSIFFSTTYIFGQTDSINKAYFAKVQEILSKDSTIMDTRYVCNRFKSGKIKDQHMYVKYKTDSIDRFWRIGKCYHYFENGKLQSSTDIDLILKRHVGIGLSLNMKGDTTWATFWGNLNDRVIPTNTIFSVNDLGKIYEMYPDKYMDVIYKKGKRKKATITIYNGKYGYISSKIFYKNDGTIDRIENLSDNSKDL